MTLLWLRIAVFLYGIAALAVLPAALYDRPRGRHLAVPATCAAVFAVVAVLATAAYGQPPQMSQKLAFDVTSIHEWGPGEGPSGPFAAGLQFSAGRVRARCVNLRGLIFNAYELNGSEPVEGMPQWGSASCGSPDSRDTFAIEATMPTDTTIAQSREMVQTLLTQRFKLAVHWESRQLPVYALRIVPGKSKLKLSDPDRDPPIPAIGCPADDPHCHIGFCCGAATMTVLTGLLSHTLERPVIDRTEMNGSYYFGVLKWAGDDSGGSSLPSLFSLLREEFGLELKAERAPVPVLVIDHAEKPTPN
jgi:uncharacterized protein (TIGR03435 family)